MWVESPIAPAVQEQYGQGTAPRRAPGADQVVRAEHLTVVRDALVVECPAGLFAVVRERDVPQQGRVHGTVLSQRPNRRLRSTVADRPLCDIQRVIIEGRKLPFIEGR